MRPKDPSNVIPFPAHAARKDAVTIDVEGLDGDVVASLIRGLQRALEILPPGRVRVSVTVESLEPPNGSPDTVGSMG